MTPGGDGPARAREVDDGDLDVLETGEFAAFDDDVDGTVVVDRSAVDDRTVVVDRELATDGIEADAAEDVDEEGTIVVARAAEAPGPSSSAAPAVDAADAAASAPSAPVVAVGAPDVLRILSRRGRRALQDAPVDAADLRPSVPAPGPGAVAPYAVRTAPEQPRPSAPPPAPSDPPPVRREDAALPSVMLASRRASLVTVAAVAGALLVSVGGLIAVGIAAFG